MSEPKPTKPLRCTPNPQSSLTALRSSFTAPA